MPLKLLSTDEFRGAAKSGSVDDAIVYRYAAAEPEQVGAAEARTQRFVFSDATVDHSGDSIDPKGWDLTVFNKNPVALFAHNSWSPPIGRASNVAVAAGKLAGDIEFADAETYPFADTIYRLVKGKFLRATSVGFRPKEWVFVNDNDRPYGIDFKKQVLLEISVCPVPCNPNALDEARSAGIDTRGLVEWAEKVLDSGDVVFMPRKDVEALRLQAKDAPPVRYYAQSERTLTPAETERVAESLKLWRADPDAIAVLPAGFSLHTIGEAKSAPAAQTVDPAGAGAGAADDGAIVERLFAAFGVRPSDDMRQKLVALLPKAGRRISAATKAVLEEAMTHHAAMGKCIKDLMEAEDDEPSQPADLDDDGGTPDPGSDIAPDEPYDLSPEEKRLREARALKASLPSDD